jgi:hypothetical protein
LSVTVVSGDTLWALAQRLLGNGNLWHELRVPGWDGNPAHLRPGMVVYLPSEQAGPPAATPATALPTGGSGGVGGGFSGLPLVSATGVTTKPTNILPGSTLVQNPDGTWSVFAAGQDFGPTDPFNSEAWKGIPQEYRNMLEALAHQFEQLTGFRVPISHQQLLEMGQANVMTLFDFGQYMWGKMSSDLQQNMPWARYGLSHEQFTAAVNDFGTIWKDMTGQDASPEQLASALQHQYTGSEWRSHLQQDANMLKTYGWLKYGLSFTQFQEAKQTMVTGLGYMPSSDQALLQLQYSQKSSDPFAASAPPAAPWSKQIEPSEASFATSVVR